MFKRILALAAVTTLAASSYAHAATASKPAEKTAQAEAFPAVGHEYRVDFGNGNAFSLAFQSDKQMKFTKLEEPGIGQAETVQFTQRKIRDGVYLVYWQEASKTTVVHVEDFVEGMVYTNITTPDGTFYNSSSRLTKLK